MERPAAHAIRTPDQRLRVFVSSTLEELAAERRAVRAAIERLSAAPVMFELGARPHPPRDLYRAYLQQSDVFVGLYWHRYGWVAPNEAVSGLEDEYDLAPSDMPRLVYIKRATGEREPRLDALLQRIKADDSVSYKAFTDADELGDLVVADLATMLAERFDQSRHSPSAELPGAPAGQQVGLPVRAALPAQLTELIGREEEVEAVAAMLRTPLTRMVTLTGPGGIGKTRLALAVAQRLEADFPDGARFVPLATVDQPQRVAGVLAQATGVRDTGDMPLEEKLALALSGRRTLLVLDNFEQIRGAGPLLTRLLLAAPDLKLLVTSRTLLRLSGERSFPVGPLDLPDTPGDDAASVRLFVERARAVRPDFELDADNVAAVEAICRALDGLPLAIELAAARIRMLSPAALLARLDHQLAMLTDGQQDLPPRQRALRSTIEWSTQLLAEEERRQLSRLGVFAGRFSLDAAMALSDEQSEMDALALLSALVDSSLLRQHERDGRTYFSLLATVREYALEQLGEEAAELRDRHARHYIDWARAVEPRLGGPELRRGVSELDDEWADLSATARHLLDSGRWDETARFAWSLYVYLWLAGHLGEVRGWAEVALRSGAPLAPYTRAIALYFTCAITYWRERADWIEPGLAEAADLFAAEGARSEEALTLISLALARLSGGSSEGVPAVIERSIAAAKEARNTWVEGMALVVKGRVALAHQDLASAFGAFPTALRLATDRHDEFAETIAENHLGWACALAGRAEEAEEHFRHGLEVSVRLGHVEGIAYGLESFVGIAALRQDAERSAELAGAAQALRERVGLYNPAEFRLHDQLADVLRAADPAGYRRAFERGRALGTEDAIALARALVAPAGTGS